MTNGIPGSGPARKQGNQENPANRRGSFRARLIWAERDLAQGPQGGNSGNERGLGVNPAGLRRYNEGAVRQLGGITALVAAVLLAPMRARPVDFQADVRPILSDRCFACHGPDEATRLSPLRLDLERGVFAELGGGRFAVVPGKPRESELIRRVAAEDPATRMPPAALGHAPLSSEEIRILTEWVRGGAPWSAHWAFAAPRRPSEDGLQAEPRVRNSVDRFVFDRLRREGLSPSEPASRATLLRRVTLDLTGLPPTPEEVRGFLADESADAYARVVERLLASPRFGERLAYRWLDAARYADTNGYQNDRPRDMWRWRDWVIEAFNANLPFDRFTIEQLAGDLLPEPTRAQRIATGFNRNHRGNAENGTDPDEYQVEYAVDRVETTATVWLGLTMGCARCHDHKYDPITQKEFYRFLAYFNNVADRGRYYKYGNTPPIVHAPTQEQAGHLAALDRRIRRLETDLAALGPAIDEALAAYRWTADGTWAYEDRLAARRTFDQAGESGAGRRGRAATFDGQRYYDLGDAADYDFYDAFTVSAWIRPAAETGGIVARYKADSPKGYGLFLVGGKLQLRIDTASISDRMRIESVEPIPLGAWTHVSGTYDGSRTTSGMKLYIDGREAPTRMLVDESLNNTRTPAPLRIGYGPGPEDRFRGLIDDARVYSRALEPEQAAVLAVAETGAEIAAIEPDERTSAQRRKLRWAFLAGGAPADASAIWTALREARFEREDFLASLPTVMVMEERRDPRPTHVLFRGSFDAPRERVEPGLPAALPPLPADAPNDRLGLARWLTDPAHPLTARVTVNRFWQMLFGRGIVATAEDFGSQGAAPTHPELLDWLAIDFVDSGWDVKRLLRTIVTSATYRQSSQVSQHELARDPENLLLARAPRQRLPAESIRDQALAIAGLLGGESGGPSVKPYQPSGLWKELSNWGAYENDHGAKLYRRSLYTFWKRTLGPPAMLAFDAAPRETCAVRETRTNTPVQALNLMNDPTYMEAARLYAERMLKDGGADDDARLAYGFLLATARPPAEREARLLRASLNRYRDRYQTSPNDAERYLAIGEHARDSAFKAPEVAAYTAVASLLLNLDETITRE